MNLFIVTRDTDDGIEWDIFTDYELAEEWANHIGAEVFDGDTIDRETRHDRTYRG